MTPHIRIFYFIAIFIFSPLFFTSINAQEFEVGDCGLSVNKKANSAFEKAIDKKKYNFSERIHYYNEAIEIDPDFILALWGKTFAQVKSSRGKQKSFDFTQSSLLEIIDQCPQIHSAPYFFLGEIFMRDEDYENAALYYDKFVHFSDDDDSKFERRYEEQLQTAKTNVKLAEFLAFQYGNPQPYNAKKVMPLSTPENDEYLPTISPDNDVMLFTRRIELQENEKESYVKSDKIAVIERFSVSSVVDGKFQVGQAFGEPFNTNPKANYGGSTISADNKEIFFTICEPVQGKMNCDIYSSRYEVANGLGVDREWTKPENLGPNINTEKGWESQPTISKDGKWLMYAVYKDGTRGIDIFQSYRNEDGTWGEGETMGEPINTSGDEKSPFFHSDVKTLYFASRDGHLGLGGYDVFMSKFIDGKWTEPVNLGYPLNTPGDEHGYIVSLDGATAYFGSAAPFNSAKEKSIDLFSVELPLEIRPEKVLMVKGVVKNESDEVPKDAVIEMRNTLTQKVETFDVDTIDGSYTAIVNVENSADFMLTAKGKDLAFNNKLVKAPKPKEPIKKKVDVAVVKSKVGQRITIENIYFNTNSANLSDVSRASLDALIVYMKESPTFRISVDGHTDNVGDPSTNLALSTDRAYSVMAYLQENGISASRLKFKGWGAAKPITSNNTEQGRAENRRIEIVVLSK